MLKMWSQQVLLLQKSYPQVDEWTYWENKVVVEMRHETWAGTLRIFAPMSWESWYWKVATANVAYQRLPVAMSGNYRIKPHTHFTWSNLLTSSSDDVRGSKRTAVRCLYGNLTSCGASGLQTRVTVGNMMKISYQDRNCTATGQRRQSKAAAKTPMSVLIKYAFDSLWM